MATTITTWTSLIKQFFSDLVELAERMINEVIQWFRKRQFRVAGDGFYTILAGINGQL
jgi:hypothetical protein